MRGPKLVVVLVALSLCVVTGGRSADAEESVAQRAQPHVDAAQEAFDDERYDEALREFRAARELLDEPMLTYNIALCLERQGELRDAIDEYNRYLRIAPEADNAEDVREKIEELHRRRVEERDAAVEVEAADSAERRAGRERLAGRGLLNPDTHHELDLVVGTAIGLAGLQANPGGASLSVEFDWHYRLTPTWHVGVAGLYDAYFDTGNLGDAEQSQFGAMASGRYARQWLDGRIEVRAVAGLGYEFLRRDHGRNRHWIFVRAGGTFAYAFWRGLGVQLNMGLRGGVLAGGDDPDSHFGMSFDILLGLFVAF